jgi:hypothetical protein
MAGECAQVTGRRVTEPGLQADSPLVTVPLQARDKPELVRQHYLGELTKLINAQLNLLAVVVYKPDKFPVVLGVTADHNLGCDMMLNAACHAVVTHSLQSATGGYVPNLVRAAMVQQQNAATTLPRTNLNKPS